MARIQNRAARRAYALSHAPAPRKYVELASEPTPPRPAGNPDPLCSRCRGYHPSDDRHPTE